MEHILCAAIWYDDGKEYKNHFKPKNIRTGFVVCGRRHSNCGAILSLMSDFPFKKEQLKEGFLTSTDRFVDRIEGRKIAFLAKQIEDEEPDGVLISEELY